MVRKYLILVQLVLFFIFGAGAGTLFEQGEQLLMDNKPNEAKALLEDALAEEPMNEKIYIDLAAVHEMLNDHKGSLAVLKRGVNMATSLKYLFYYNMGNNLYTMGQNMLASEMYTRAIAYNSGFEGTYLNRANTRVNLEEYRAAVADYRKYLQVKPGTPQRPQIEAIIDLLTAKLDAFERLQREQKEKDDNLKNLLNSLENASDNTKNLSVGAEKLEQDYEEEDILD